LVAKMDGPLDGGFPGGLQLDGWPCWLERKG